MGHLVEVIVLFSQVVGSQVPHGDGSGRGLVIVVAFILALFNGVRVGGVGLELTVPWGGHGGGLAAVSIPRPVTDLSTRVEMQATWTAHRVFLVSYADVEKGWVRGVADINALKASAGVSS